jgi:hypothetical protein
MAVAQCSNIRAFSGVSHQKRIIYGGWVRKRKREERIITHGCGLYVIFKYAEKTYDKTIRCGLCERGRSLTVKRCSPPIHSFVFSIERYMNMSEQLGDWPYIMAGHLTLLGAAPALA